MRSLLEAAEELVLAIEAGHCEKCDGIPGPVSDALAHYRAVQAELEAVREPAPVAPSNSGVGGVYAAVLAERERRKKA